MDREEDHEEVLMARVGRPTIQEQLGDSLLAEKAKAYRASGCSWSEVARRLKVGRSTARRLALCQNAHGGAEGTIAEESGSRTSPGRDAFRNGTSNVPEAPQDERRDPDVPAAQAGVSEEDVVLPESFRLFRMILRRAGEGGLKPT